MPNTTSYAIDFGTGYYQDEGCPDGEFPSCLSCPLIICKYERAELQDMKHKFKATYFKDEIIKRLQSGESQRSIRRSLGVGEAAVKRVKDELDEQGLLEASGTQHR